MMAIAVSSIVVAIFDVKYNFHLQVRVLPARPFFRHQRIVSACPTHLKRPPGKDELSH